MLLPAVVQEAPTATQNPSQDIEGMFTSHIINKECNIVQNSLGVRQPSEDLWKTRSKISLLTRRWIVTSSYLRSSDLHIANYVLTCICCKRFSVSDNSPNIHWTRLRYRPGSLKLQDTNSRLYFPYLTGKLTLSLCLFLFNCTQNIRIPQGATKPSPHQEGPPQVFT